MIHMSEIDHLRIAKSIMESHGIYSIPLTMLIADLVAQEQESDICPSCRGKGSYEALKENYQGRVIGSHHQKCWTCGGTGKKPDDVKRLEKKQ